MISLKLMSIQVFSLIKKATDTTLHVQEESMILVSIYKNHKYSSNTSYPLLIFSK